MWWSSIYTLILLLKCQQFFLTVFFDVLVFDGTAYRNQSATTRAKVVLRSGSFRIIETCSISTAPESYLLATLIYTYTPAWYFCIHRGCGAECRSFSSFLPWRATSLSGVDVVSQTPSRHLLTSHMEFAYWLNNGMFDLDPPHAKWLPSLFFSIDVLHSKRINLNRDRIEVNQPKRDTEVSRVESFFFLSFWREWLSAEEYGCTIWWSYSRLRVILGLLGCKSVFKRSIHSLLGNNLVDIHVVILVFGIFVRDAQPAPMLSRGINWQINGTRASAVRMAGLQDKHQLLLICILV